MERARFAARVGGALLHVTPAATRPGIRAADLRAGGREVTGSTGRTG